MKIFLSIICVFCIIQSSPAQSGTWTWMKGDSATSSAGTWGVQGVASTLNTPPSCYEGAHWIDANGDFWLFGSVTGYGASSALWKFNVTSNEWTWIKGPNTFNQPGVYGTMGIPDANNNPGARGWGMLFWKDSGGNFWIYGGGGYDAFGDVGTLSDLWMYSPLTNEWTWMSGSNSTSQSVNWGSYQVFDSANLPGLIGETNCTWVDSSDNLWCFGGGCVGSIYNAVWEFRRDINQWAWMNGANSGSPGNNYGTMGVFNVDNHPSARFAYCSWVDQDNKFSFFGGGDNYGTSFSDVWEFDPEIKQWAWIGGSNTPDVQGTYVNYCDSSSAYVPHARMENTAHWIDDCGNVWMYGGLDYLSNGDAVTFSDLWVFTSHNTWVWIDGPQDSNVPPFNGVLGVSSSACTPGGRFGSASWRDVNGNLWLYGGWGITGNTGTIYGDLWKYTIDTACIINLNCNSELSFNALDTNLCEKFCTSFLDTFSSNTTTWQWQFPGGDPSSSTDQNPTNICYDVPGVYDVTLITTNGNGSDTLTLHNYITVYPTPPIPTITQNGYMLTSSPAEFYQWQLDAMDIPGATNQSFSVLQTGFYTVIVSDLNGCKNSTTLYIQITGIDEVRDTIISVYPNPTTGNIVIECTGNTDRILSIEIKNALSQSMLFQEETALSSKNRTAINLLNAVNGIYFIEIRTENYFVRKKIILMK